MKNPLSFLGDKWADVKADVILRARIILRVEDFDICMSRLIVLDPVNKDLYQKMRDMMENERQ